MKKTLHQRLKNYDSSAKSLITTRTLRDRAGKFPLYAAVTGSALAMATSASASIISYAGGPVTVTASHSKKQATATVSLTGMPAFFLGARFSTPRPGTFQGSGAAIAGNLRAGKSNLQLLGSLGLPFELSNGAVGPASGNFFQGQGLLASSNNSHEGGKWASESSGRKSFEGFRFATGLGGFDYGWAQLSWQEVGISDINSVTLYALAYDNTPNEAIGVGATSASSGTPEPGTAPLMLLALGSAGVVALRRNKMASNS